MLILILWLVAALFCISRKICWIKNTTSCTIHQFISPRPGNWAQPSPSAWDFAHRRISDSPLPALQGGNELWEQKVKWIAGSRWWPFVSWCQLEHFLGGTWRRWKMGDVPNMMVMMASMICLSLNISSIPHCASRFLRAYDGTIAFHLPDLSTLGFESFGAIFFSGAVAETPCIRKWQLDRRLLQRSLFSR